MKNLINLLFLLLFCAAASAQEETIELVEILTIPDTVFCPSDTTPVTPVYYIVEKTTTDYGAQQLDVRVDTFMIRNGNCPADSLFAVNQFYTRAKNIRNKSARIMSRAFEEVRNQRVKTYNSLESVINSFTGSNLDYLFEDEYWPTLEGQYKVFDLENPADTNYVIMTMIRIGASDRYRLEINDGWPGAGTRYTVIPNSKAL